MIPLAQALGLLTTVAEIVSKKNLKSTSTITGATIAAGGIAAVQSGQLPFPPDSMEGYAVQIVVAIIGIIGLLRKSKDNDSAGR